MAASQLAAFALAVLLARTLGAEGFGHFQMLVATSVAAAVICKFGLDEALAYRIPQSALEERGSLALYSTALTGVVGCVGGGTIATAMVFGKPPFAVAIPNDVWWTLPFLTASTCMLAVSLGALRGEGAFLARSFIYYVGVGFGTLVFCGALWALSRLTVTSAVTTRTVIFGAGAVCAFVVLLHKRRRFKWGTPAGWRDVTHLGAWVSLTSLTQYLVEQPLIDLYFVGAFADATAVGIYSVAARLASLVLMVGAVLTIVAGPSLAKATAESRTAQYSRWSDVLTVATTAGGCLLILARFPLFKLFGSEYAAAPDPVFLCLAGFFATAAALGLNTPLLLSSGGEKADFAAAAVGVVLMVAGGGILGPRFGVAGIATATGISAVAVAVAKRLAVVRWSGVGIGVRDVVRFSFGLLTMVGALITGYREELGRVTLAATLLAVVTWGLVVEARRANA